MSMSPTIVIGTFFEIITLLQAKLSVVSNSKGILGPLNINSLLVWRLLYTCYAIPRIKFCPAKRFYEIMRVCVHMYVMAHPDPTLVQKPHISSRLFVVATFVMVHKHSADLDSPVMPCMHDLENTLCCPFVTCFFCSRIS